jgi:hypothetical protein
MHRLLSVVATLAAFSASASLRAQRPPLADDRAAGAAVVTVEHCKAWLGTLASPEFEGRGTGQEGFRKAAEFVRDRFADLGLTPQGDDSTFFQAVPWTVAQADLAATCLEFHSPGGGVLHVPADRLEGQVSQSLTAEGKAVLIVLSSAAGRSNEPIAELANVDVKGKVVLLHVQPAAEARTPQMASFRAVAQVRDKEPAAIVLDTKPVRGGLTARSGAGRGGANRAVRGARLSLTSVRLGGDDTKTVLAASGLDEAALQTVGATELALTAKVNLAVRVSEAAAWNVVGVLPGSDEQLRQEYVVIGSHLDHLGKRGATIYPGADDDASGTTGVLAVATMFAKNPVPPKRSVLFVCFAGEENGLVGSSWFVEHPPVPLASIVAELQMDMIGRNEESDSEKPADNENTLHLVGTQRLSRDLHELCMHKNASAGFDLEWDEESVFSRSDHANFAKKGIPIAFFFTGFHHDYHQPSDTPDKIDFGKLLRVATYVYDIAFELGSQSSRPLVDAELWATNRAGLRGAEQPAAPVRDK